MFRVLDSVDSTNNYAMELVQDGLANHGDAWFAKEQFSGKGQRGKIWKSTAGMNLILSIVITPTPFFQQHPALFNMAVASLVADFLQNETKEKFCIKWPNDLYWNDRKAGGILIENRFSGPEWKWAIIGIGINVKQMQFPSSLPNPVSLCQIKSREWDPEALARKLYSQLIKGLEQKFLAKTVLSAYNNKLYKKGQEVGLKKGNTRFTTTIGHIDGLGQLHTHDVMDRVFAFGEVEWVIRPHSLIR
ncbi:MAG: biotin--[acetyl-CoA-carboxylase] ligase [Chitinophagaceae bacterium]|nr:biotin--[acetyl-CoA-carboxylase] ligase [Bacteroidota bacterium]MCC6258268.1 biotin--[acetyl-CoA-carboxylase] ligase [Chitinophagaceae bacterium]